VWKITDEDWRNRKRNRDYDTAAEEMFERTDHHLAPWNLIGAEQKRYARVRVMEVLTERVEQGMQRWGFPVPSRHELNGATSSRGSRRSSDR
jgi:polyphosphate kinase 2 (PPK2 family)